MPSDEERLRGEIADPVMLMKGIFIRPEPKNVQYPSQGRIVIYQHPGSADGRYPPTTSPAIVQQVSTTDPMKCFLFVFGPKGQHMDWSDYGTGPCQWHWPERV